jgi:hypothetical protein
MKIPKHIIDSVKNSVGYSEAVNKDSFMVGVSVAFYRAEDYFSNQIASLNSRLEGYKAASEDVDKDMKTLVSILDKYRSHD